MTIPFILKFLDSIGIPEPFQKILQWVVLVALAVGAFFAVKAIYDASVVEDYENKRTITSVESHNSAAEERAYDKMRELMDDQRREEAIAKAEAEQLKLPPERRDKLPATTLAANCQKMREAFTKKELAKMPVFQERCVS